MSKSGLANTPSALVVGIATRGRPEILRETLVQVLAQTVSPSRILVCHTGPGDIAGLDFPAVEFFIAPSGLPRQRNAILDRLPDTDAVLFIDDDFLMAPRYIEATLAALQASPDLVLTTGDLLADGIKGPGITPGEARDMIQADPAAERTGVHPAEHGYGCNMAIRLDIARQHGLRFDERLPLYAWSEDMDFSYRLGRFGHVAKLEGARGVHLGTKGGRTSGHRLGYSQVANPIYLCQKGSYTLRRAAGSVGRNLAANLVRAAWPEPWIDRRGRLLGNVRAMGDIVRGRLAPERILEL